jgi:hypothetical protein
MKNECLHHCALTLIKRMQSDPFAEEDGRSILALVASVLKERFPECDIVGLARGYRRGPFAAVIRVLGVEGEVLSLEGLQSWEAWGEMRYAQTQQYKLFWNKEIQTLHVSSELNWKEEEEPCSQWVKQHHADVLAYCKATQEHWELTHQKSEPVTRLHVSPRL